MTEIWTVGSEISEKIDQVSTLNRCKGQDHKILTTLNSRASIRWGTRNREIRKSEIRKEEEEIDKSNKKKSSNHCWLVFRMEVLQMHLQFPQKSLMSLGNRNSHCTFDATYSNSHFLNFSLSPAPDNVMIGPWTSGLG